LSLASAERLQGEQITGDRGLSPLRAEKIRTPSAAAAEPLLSTGAGPAAARRTSPRHAAEITLNRPRYKRLFKYSL
jgi:hypothetical protein